MEGSSSSQKSKLSINEQNLKTLTDKQDNAKLAYENANRKVVEAQKVGERMLVDSISKSVRGKIVSGNALIKGMNSLIDRTHHIVFCDAKVVERMISEQASDMIYNCAHGNAYEEIEYKFPLARLIYRTTNSKADKQQKPSALIIEACAYLGIDENYSLASMKVPYPEYAEYFPHSKAACYPKDGSVIHNFFYLTARDEARILQPVNDYKPQLRLFARYTDGESLPVKESDRVQWENTFPSGMLQGPLTSLDIPFEFLKAGKFVKEDAWENATPIQKQIAHEVFLTYIKNQLLETIKEIYASADPLLNLSIVSPGVVAYYCREISFKENNNGQNEYNKRHREEN